MPLPLLYPYTLPTAPVSGSFGLRSSYEIGIFDTDQRPKNYLFELKLCSENLKQSTPVLSCVDLLREPRSVFTRYVYSTSSNLQLGK